MIDLRPLLKQVETEVQRLVKEAERLVGDVVQADRAEDDYSARLERLAIEVDDCPADCTVDLVAAAPGGHRVPDIFASVAASRRRSTPSVASSAGTWVYLDGVWYQEDLSVWERGL